MALSAKCSTKLALKSPERWRSFDISVIFCYPFHSNKFPPYFQMSDAPSAIKDSLGGTAKLSEKDIEAQLAKLRST